MVNDPKEPKGFAGLVELVSDINDIDEIQQLVGADFWASQGKGQSRSAMCQHVPTQPRQAPVQNSNAVNPPDVSSQKTSTSSSAESIEVSHEKTKEPWFLLCLLSLLFLSILFSISANIHRGPGYDPERERNAAQQRNSNRGSVLSGERPLERQRYTRLITGEVLFKGGFPIAVQPLRDGLSVEEFRVCTIESVSINAMRQAYIAGHIRERDWVMAHNDRCVERDGQDEPRAPIPAISRLEVSKPPFVIGAGLMLSLSEIRWCIRGVIYIDEMRRWADTPQKIHALNRRINEYNRHCASYFYSPGDDIRAHDDVQVHRQQITALARYELSRLGR